MDKSLYSALPESTRKKLLWPVVRFLPNEYGPLATRVLSGKKVLFVLYKHSLYRPPWLIYKMFECQIYRSAFEFTSYSGVRLCNGLFVPTKMAQRAIAKTVYSVALHSEREML